MRIEHDFFNVRPVQFGTVSQRAAWLRQAVVDNVGQVPVEVVHAVFDLLAELELMPDLPDVSRAARWPQIAVGINNDPVDVG